MAQRTVAEYKGTYIGIESVFTVIDGKQINIPGKVEELRALAKRNELFCTCGCGTNLTPVISDKNLREQHFRIKKGHIGSKLCTAIEEGSVSIDSKIVLKCWLEDKLKTGDIESRVPICEVGDTDRKYEYTFLSRSKSLGVSYCHSRMNLLDEKLDILEKNSSNYKVMYFQDVMNSNWTEQYPEWLMKIYNRQKYILLLQIQDCFYTEAILKVAFIEQAGGFWHEVKILEDKLSEFEITDNGELLYDGTTILKHKQKYLEEREKRLEEQRKQREEEKRKIKEREERERVEREIRKVREQEEQRLKMQQEQVSLDEQRRLYHEQQEQKRKAREQNQNIIRNIEDKREEKTCIKAKSVVNGDIPFPCPQCGSRLQRKHGLKQPYMKCTNRYCDFWDYI